MQFKTKHQRKSLEFTMRRCLVTLILIIVLTKVTPSGQVGTVVSYPIINLCNEPPAVDILLKFAASFSPVFLRLFFSHRQMLRA